VCGLGVATSCKHRDAPQLEMVPFSSPSSLLPRLKVGQLGVSIKMLLNVL